MLGGLWRNWKRRTRKSKTRPDRRFARAKVGRAKEADKTEIQTLNKLIYQNYSKLLKKNEESRFH